jgi:hypothetical protein
MKMSLRRDDLSRRSPEHKSFVPSHTEKRNNSPFPKRSKMSIARFSDGSQIIIQSQQLLYCSLKSRLDGVVMGAEMTWVKCPVFRAQVLWAFTNRESKVPIILINSTNAPNQSISKRRIMTAIKTLTDAPITLRKAHCTNPIKTEDRRLQSSSSTLRRRYMRRGSQCPSMLMMNCSHAVRQIDDAENADTMAMFSILCV